MQLHYEVVGWTKRKFKVGILVARIKFFLGEMQRKRAHVVLVCAKGTKNNSLQGYILVYYYTEEAGEKVFGIEAARELEMIIRYFYTSVRDNRVSYPI